jgi:hypothetical protein
MYWNDCMKIYKRIEIFSNLRVIFLELLSKMIRIVFQFMYQLFGLLF